MSDSKQTRRLDDVPDDDLEELNFREHVIVVEPNRVLPTTPALPPPPPAPKGDS